MIFSQDGMAQKKKKDKKDKKGKIEESDNENDKSTVKKWKKKKKAMHPLKFRDMYKQYNSLKSETSKLNRQIKTLQEQASNNESVVASKDEQIVALNNKIQEIKKNCEGVANNGTDITAGGDNYTKGIVYKVQVGAFRKKDLSKFLKKGNFWEEDIDGTRKYTIGYFRDYWEANEFKNYLRQMGVKDAWIVAYEDNERKDIKEVLEESPAIDDEKE